MEYTHKGPKDVKNLFYCSEEEELICYIAGGSVNASYTLANLDRFLREMGLRAYYELKLETRENSYELFKIIPEEGFRDENEWVDKFLRLITRNIDPLSFTPRKPKKIETYRSAVGLYKESEGGKNIMKIWIPILSKREEKEFEKKFESGLEGKGCFPSCYYKARLNDLERIVEENQKLVSRMAKFGDYVLKEKIGIVNVIGKVAEIEIVRGFLF